MESEPKITPEAADKINALVADHHQKETLRRDAEHVLRDYVHDYMDQHGMWASSTDVMEMLGYIPKGTYLCFTLYEQYHELRKSEEQTTVQILPDGPVESITESKPKITQEAAEKIKALVNDYLPKDAMSDEAEDSLRDYVNYYMDRHNMRAHSKDMWEMVNLIPNQSLISFRLYDEYARLLESEEQADEQNPSGEATEPKLR